MARVISKKFRRVTSVNNNPILNYKVNGIELEVSALERTSKACISKANRIICWVVRNLELGNNYVINKEKHNEYFRFNPHVAKKRFINLYSSGKYN